MNIRNAAINALVQFGSNISEKIIYALDDKNWLVQQSAILCIEKIIEKEKDATEIFLSPLMKVAETENSFVKTAAISALSKIYTAFKKS